MSIMDESKKTVLALIVHDFHSSYMCHTPCITTITPLCIAMPTHVCTHVFLPEPAKHNLAILRNHCFLRCYWTQKSLTDFLIGIQNNSMTVAFMTLHM